MMNFPILSLLLMLFGLVYGDGKVTIMNDIDLTDGEGTIHTWLILRDEDGKRTYFSFSNSDFGSLLGFDSTGTSSVSEKLKTRKATDYISFYVKNRNFDKMMKACKTFYDDKPKYDLLPEGNGDYNCVTAARKVLQAAGIHYLNNCSTPFCVRDKIDWSRSLPSADYCIDHLCAWVGNDKKLTVLDN